jgi:ribonuclease Z
MPYHLHFHPITEEGILVEDSKFTVECFQVLHRIECWGFLFRERRKPRKINKEAVRFYNITSANFERLKTGENIITEDGKAVLNEEVTLPNKPARSYAFCADTTYNEPIADKVKGVSLLYHETTYLKALEERAAARFHATTIQAANIAVLANVENLLIGHFSSKYEHLDEFLTEASEVFPNTRLAIEGVTYRIV